MVRYITLNNQHIQIKTDKNFSLEHVVWVDLINPNEDEKLLVEKQFQIELFTPQESEEIETSSKYVETDSEIGINLNFLKLEDENYINEAVSFILKGDILFTQRNYDYKTFIMVYKKLNGHSIKGGHDIFFSLIATRIDLDADLIEHMSEQITVISKNLIKKNNLERNILLKIAGLQESTISIRENIIVKQRILSAILKSRYFPSTDNDNLQVMIKDITSLLDYTNFNFERLEFLQDTFLGLVNMEQSRIIKIFTIATVVFMPPTLIAGIYGMNFDTMPELHWLWGYPLALLLILSSSIGILFFFKLKKWI